MEEKDISKDWRLWLGVIATAIIISIGVIYLNRNIPKQVASTSTEQISDEDIIEFAKEEIKKKLRYPDTAKFQKEEIIGKEGNKSVVNMYCISDDRNHEEGRMQFVLGIKNNNGRLETLNIGTNEQTCNTDVAKEFEDLVNEKKYSEIYDNLFSNTLKNKLSKSDFINYNLDLSGSKTEAKPNVDSNNYLKYVTTVTIDKDGQYWTMMIKNGMIYNFSKVLF